EKVAGFLGTMDKLDGHLEKARQSFEDAKGQLSTGRGNVVRQVEMLRELGAKSSKSLPAGWDGGAGDLHAVVVVGKDVPGALAGPLRFVDRGDVNRSGNGTLRHLNVNEELTDVTQQSSRP